MRVLNMRARLYRCEVERVAETSRASQPQPSRNESFFFCERMSNHMTFALHTTATRESRDLPRETATRGLVQHRLGEYLFASAVVASGVALNWSWEAVARLFPILEFLPSILMVPMYMRDRTRPSSDDVVAGQVR
jgi:hypothetical protein